MGSAAGAVGRGGLVPAGARGSEGPEAPLDPPPTDDGTSPLAAASRPWLVAAAELAARMPF